MSTFYLDYENGNDANSGADWANAWKTITTGATAARIAPGDTIRIAKSPDPVSLGMTATWTNLSKTVTLSSALTLEVNDCDSGWTAANSSTVTHPTATRKEGSAHVTITKATYATSTLYAYKALAGSTDFSAYDALTFWVRNDAAIADAVRWKVCLCSDTAGAVIVDTFWVPAIPSTNRWLPVTIAKSGGGSLGAAIQSVAIYSGTSAPTNGQDLLVDNINACTYGGFSLQSLVSKSSSAAYNAAETWYGIQSIVGTTVMLDLDTNTIATSTLGYSGTTETVTTYRRETIKTALAAAATTAVQEVQDSGTLAGGNITFSGGWDTGTSTQTGMTLFDGLNGNGYGVYPVGESYITLTALGCVRYSRGVYLSSSSNCTVSSVIANNNTLYGVILATSWCNTVSSVTANNNTQHGVYSANSPNCTVSSVTANNNTQHGVYLSSSPNCTVSSVTANNNTQHGVYLSSSPYCTVSSASMSGNASADARSEYGDALFIDSTFGSATEVYATVAYYNDRVRSQNHDLGGYDWEWTDGGTINSEATNRVGGTGKMWKLLTSSTSRTSAYPLDWELAPVALVGGETTTVKVWLKKAHATNVDGKLVCRGGQVDGISTDEVATLANNTNWQELTLTLSPTNDCVVLLEVWAEYVAGHAAVYVDEISDVSSV